MTMNDLKRPPAGPGRRQMTDRLVHAAGFAVIVAQVGLLMVAVLADLSPAYVIAFALILTVAVICASVVRDASQIYRRQRDKYRQVAIDLALQWPDDDRADALDWVPAEVLAAAGLTTDEEADR
ncbi:hypothetical protein [Nonomuraea typhae]|uniref:Uncharacterized protein n=1 Tax=Nonomuraea typhae TaxID=2603600 RepID=A0ABW7YLR8_9ACTN